MKLDKLNVSLLKEIAIEPPLESTLVFTILLSLIFSFSLLFNILSITSIITAKAFTTINLLIVNLGLADITYSLGIPFFIIQIYQYEIPFGVIGCRLFIFTEFSGIIVGIFTVAALSVERFMDVADKKKLFETFSNKFKLFIIIIYCFLIWILSICFSLPLVFSIKLNNHNMFYSCQSEWKDQGIRFYFITKFLGIFIIPYFIIIISSVKLLIFLNKWKTRMSETKRNSTYSASARLKSRNRAVKLKYSNEHFSNRISHKNKRQYSINENSMNENNLSKSLPIKELNSDVKLNVTITHTNERCSIFNCLSRENTNVKKSVLHKSNGNFINTIRRKAIRLVLVIIFLFLIQWSPFWIFQIVMLFSTNVYENVQLINMIVSTLSYSNTVANPALYMLLTYNFKKYFNKGLKNTRLGKHFSMKSNNNNHKNNKN